MDYTYVADGSIFIGGISTYEAIYVLISKFNVGDIVYDRPKALKGILEKFCIKKLRFSNETDPYGIALCKICTFAPLYIDTLNAYHNEEDLIEYSEAVELVQAYTEQAHAALEESLRE